LKEANVPAKDWPLCVLDLDDTDALIAAYRQIYVDRYVHAEVRDWAGRRIRFHATNFNHAFSESNNYRLEAGGHDVDLSLTRAERIFWIRLALQGEDVCIDVLSQERRDGRGQLKRRRTLVVLDNNYVVVLEPCTEAGFEFQFITAFVADRSYMERIRRGATVLERRRQK
jgi:hypothetical protein